jgi:hypothetical protein
VDSVEEVKNAVFEAGAGKLGNYDSCCWMTLGRGQFKPLKGSNPYLGVRDKIVSVDEYKVEMICNEEIAADVLSAFKKVHPYEEPAFHFTKIEYP